MEEMFKEDAMTIARNILSGKNACGMLQLAVDRGDVAYFAAADAVLKVKREEMEHVREQRDMARNDVDKYRFALEIMVQNMIPVTGGMLLSESSNIRVILEKTLGRAISWDTG